MRHRSTVGKILQSDELVISLLVHLLNKTAVVTEDTTNHYFFHRVAAEDCLWFSCVRFHIMAKLCLSAIVHYN